MAMPDLYKRVENDASGYESDGESIPLNYEDMPTLDMRVEGSDSDNSDDDTFAVLPPIAKRRSSKRKSNSKGTPPPTTRHKTKPQLLKLNTKPINTQPVPHSTKPNTSKHTAKKQTKPKPTRIPPEATTFQAEESEDDDILNEKGIRKIQN